ncbi:hypothetical protein L4174_014810 [Photobacterium sp. CCB-ST2H9]|uniref:ABC transporter substrate binding protein n=1 Tax=Photobacterium sp. CCB-ST2H9 TaxID=2912855 RepID=UPI0020054B60|nr:ABC transporter substrate binding protein [Photobacterium sp. CCB-ST2H9]UTM57050.1 hypothetical protein L4174_014810 [Photobacterium sp. CCB-ST2H9]
MIRPLILIAGMLFSALGWAQWPQWLGEQLSEQHQQRWEIEAGADSVTFTPRGAHPQVWVLMSRKASAYDTALSSLLTTFRRDLPSASFRVFVLPQEPSELEHWTKRAEQEASLIYSVGSQATASLYRVYAGGKLPVVSVNAKDPVLLGLSDGYASSGNNFAFTSLNLPADITFSFLRRFRPQLTQIGVLYASANTSAYLTQYLPLKTEAERRGVRVFPIEVDESHPEQGLEKVLKKQVADMRKQDEHLAQSLLWLTGSSSLLERIGEINAHSGGLPLLTAVPDAVNGSAQSALMSVGVGFENNAHQAALYGIRILRDHTQPAALPVGVLSPPDISISFRQAERVQTPVPFVLIEMASDIYARDGSSVRAAGMSMENPQP